MSSRGGEQNLDRSFAILGIGADEERVYRQLLSRPEATVADVARNLSLDNDRVKRLLSSMGNLGLVAQSQGKPWEYIAVSPDIAMEHLILEKQGDLQRAQNALQKLRQDQLSLQQRNGTEQLVEVITGPDAERKIFDQMHRIVRKEMINMSAPPLVISRLDVKSEVDDRFQREAQARGVGYRAIYDSRLFNIPGVIDRVFDDIDAGEQVRVSDSVPFKFFIADRRLGLLPLIRRQTENHIVLLVRSSPLLEALCNLFEIVWQHSSPMSREMIGDPDIGTVRSRLPEGSDNLISLMAAGLNDKRIADEMGISATTLKRRISALMKAFNARTRFQLGRLTDAHSFDRNLDK